MSLLRTCQHTLTRPAAARIAAAGSRLYTDSSVIPAEANEKPVATQQPQEVTTADVISGAPVELRHRLVRIYQPTRNTMQIGSVGTERWHLDWDILQGAGRWQNPLMGWASSADYMQGTRMTFRSKEDAMHFAEKQGWDYYVQLPAETRIPPKNYSQNFVYSPNKLRLLLTK